jgi:hypothetical protein
VDLATLWPADPEAPALDCMLSLCESLAELVKHHVSRWSADYADHARLILFACEEQLGVQQGKRAAGRTNASAEALREVVGSVRMLAAVHGSRFYTPSPLLMRKCLGLPAGASKQQMARMSAQLLSLTTTTPGVPGGLSGHEADAAAVSIAAHRMYRSLP